MAHHLHRSATEQDYLSGQIGHTPRAGAHRATWVSTTNHEQNEVHRKAQMLRKLTPFENFSKKEIMDAAQMVVPKDYERGAYLCRQEEDGTDLFIQLPQSTPF